MKKIIVAAVAAAIIAPAASMAAGPVLYGKIHTSIDYLDNNGSSSQDSNYNEWSLQSNSSRVGVKGSEDLGNGMKVGYLIEWGTDMASGSGSLTERNRAITLSGDWGTALAGKWDTPFKSTARKLDLFGDRVGDTRSLSKFATTENRAANVLAYVTPNMNGFSATLAYVFDAGTGDFDGTGPDDNSVSYSDDNSDNNAYSFNAIYNNGPIMAVLGYVNYSDDGVNAPVGVSTDDASAWRLGGAYSFGDFKAIASYTDFENQNFDKDMDTSMWTLGGSYKMGNNTIKLQYSDLDDTDRSNIDDGADMWTIGLDHAMSKRTTVYALYTSLENDDDSSRVSWGAGNGHGGTAAAATGEDADGFSVGIIHNF